MESIGIVSTVKAPLSQLHRFVNYHLNVGVDHIILFFDDPNDEGLISFGDYSQVTTIACSTEYWRDAYGYRPESIEARQKFNVNNAAKRLLVNKFCWLINIDFDELIHPSRSLRELLSHAESDVVVFKIMEAVAEQAETEHIFHASLFKARERKRIIKGLDKLKCFHSIYRGEYFRGHVASKSAVRVKPSLVGHYGIHAPLTSQDVTTQYMESIELLHFDCVSVKEWKFKWNRRLDGTGLALEMRDNRREQMRLYEEAVKGGEETLVSLFIKMHGVRKIERPLFFLLGMLKRVKINEALFDRVIR